MVNLGPGFGEGFTSGMNAASAHREAVARQQALQQDALNNKLSFYENAANSMIEHIQAVISSAPQRNDALNTAVQNLAAPVEELAKGIAQLPSDKAATLSKVILSNLSAVQQTPTMAEKATNEAKAKYEGVKAQAQAAGIPIPGDQSGVGAPQMAGGLGQSMPAPAAPPAPPSAPDQQTAAAAPLQPGITTQPVVTGGGPAPAAAPEAPAAAPMQQPTMADQAAAQPQAPVAPKQQQVIQTNPTMEWSKRGEINTGSIPLSDIELVVAHPEMAPQFENKYGVSADQLLKDPTPPGGGKQTFQDMLNTAYGIKDSAETKAMAAETAKSYTKAKDAITTARTILANNLEARTLLDKGIYAGLLSGPDLAIARAKVALDMADQETQDKVERTQSYIAALTKSTAQIIKQFGSGTGLSDADREFAARAAGQDITFTPGALRRILDINSRAALWVLANPQKAAKAEEAASGSKK